MRDTFCLRGLKPHYFICLIILIIVSFFYTSTQEKKNKIWTNDFYFMYS